MKRKVTTFLLAVLIGCPIVMGVQMVFDIAPSSTSHACCASTQSVSDSAESGICDALKVDANNGVEIAALILTDFGTVSTVQTVPLWRAQIQWAILTRAGPHQVALDLSSYLPHAPPA